MVVRVEREPTSQELHHRVDTDEDLLAVRRAVRSIAERLGFGMKDVTSIVTSVSELARNMLVYANGGEMTVRTIAEPSRVGIEIIAADRGPGIADIRRALMDGYSTSGGLGMGLPGVQRLMDTFDIRSETATGTVVTAAMWLEEK